MSFDWQKLKGLKETRAKVAATMEEIAKMGNFEFRDLSSENVAKYNDASKELDKLDADIEGLEKLRDVQQRANVNPGTQAGAYKPAIGQPETRDDQSAVFSPLKGEWERRSLAKNAGQQSEPLSISKYIRGVMMGDWKDAEAERRAMSTTGTGSAIVPTPLSANLIQGAFNQSRIMQAGSVTVPMDSATLKMARVAGAPQAGWKAENAAMNVADGPLDSVTFTAKTLAVAVKMSLELNEDAKNADAVIQQEMSQAMGLTLDAAALYGTGTLNDPVGLANISGVQSINSVGNLTNYSNFSVASQRILENNGQPNAVILSPNSYGILDRLTDTLGQPMRKPDSVAALSFLPTNQVKLQPVTVTITGETGGTFTISVTAGGSTQTTAGIAYNASATTVSNAIAALSNVGSGNVSVTGSAGGPYTITFAGYVGWLGAVKVTVDGTGLTGSSPSATATAITSAFVGDFRQLMVGVKSTLIIEMSREASDATTSAWVNGQLFLRAWMRCDIQAAHPNQFCILNGITVA